MKRPSPFALALTLLFGGACAAESPATVGEMAPDFHLQGSDGTTVRLSDFKGKQAVVVAWFPKAFTGG